MSKLMAKVSVKKIRYNGQSDKGWKQYTMHLDLSKVTCTERMDPMISYVIPPGVNMEPSVGDQILIQRIRPRTWMPVEGSYFNGLEDYQYKIPKGEMQPIKLGGETIDLYRKPNLMEVRYLEMKPVLCWYNPISDEKHLTVITRNVISLAEQPDSVMFAIFERTKDNTQAHCIGAWHSNWACYQTYEKIEKVISVIRKMEGK